MSVEQQATRVASGAKSALKALIQKLGGTVPDSTKIDGLATIVDSIDLGDKFMLIPVNPTTHDILWYDENTESWVLANLNPTTIGAAASGHTHTKAAITDFPTSMPPAAHKASHKTGGSDAITPADIGAAAASHTHSYLPLSGGTLTGNLTGQYITGTWLQTTAVTDKAGNFATIDGDGWVYYRTPAEVRTDIGAAAASHNHSATNITSGTLPITRGGTGSTTAATALTNLGAVPKSGGTMTGPLVAQTNTSYTTAQMRNVIISTADPSGGNNGDIWLKYEA